MFASELLRRMACGRGALPCSTTDVKQITPTSPRAPSMFGTFPFVAAPRARHGLVWDPSWDRGGSWTCGQSCSSSRNSARCCACPHPASPAPRASPAQKEIRQRSCSTLADLPLLSGCFCVGCWAGCVACLQVFRAGWLAGCSGWLCFWVCLAASASLPMLHPWM